MNPQSVILFLSLLAVIAQLIVVVTVLAWAGGNLSRRFRQALVDQLGPYATHLALVVSLVATLGSLYLSERAHFTPCRLCWYQRIAMYPQVALHGAALIARRRDVRLYSTTLAVIGGCISCYHMLLERFPNLETSVCEIANPCTLIWTNRFGYLTIPTMALSGFALLVTLHRLGAAYDKQRDSTEGREELEYS
ncbi:MAG: disulfide bond formation protein B [Acidimicrobiia bacterium]